MKVRTVILCAFLLLSGTSFSQTRFMLTGAMDVIKTDFKKTFDKFQGGIEINYFPAQKISVNAGYDFWSDSKNYYAVGGRYYLFSFVFIRPRLLFNEDKMNGSLALGYKFIFRRRLSWESYFDYYFSSPELAIRTGIAYTFTR